MPVRLLGKVTQVRLLGKATLVAVTSLLVIAAAAAGAATAAAATDPYVSLGDSYTAAPLVPSPTGNPILCGRSTNNYPSDVARASRRPASPT